MSNKKNKNTTVKNIKKAGTVDKYRFSAGWWIGLAALLILTWIVYAPALKNTLTGWDDKNYVTINKDIQHTDGIFERSFSLKTGYVMGNYHPITMLSYALEYRIGKLEPRLYHTTNIIIHLINTLLVFLFIRILARNNLTGLITAALFALHPMHVESVAWVAERKDLLYVMFEMAALIAYAYYSENSSKRKWLYPITIILFMLSVLSKAMAISLVMILPLIDYFKGRKLLSTKVILEKIPFFILAIVFGIIAILAQKSAKTINIEDYSFYDRILFAGYGLVTYMWKSILPLGLSTYYDYPLKGTYGWYIVYVLIVLAAGYFVYRSMKYTKVVLFGMLFFLFSVVLILQILPVGGAIIAERYTYAAYTGLFFMIAYGINYVIESKEKRINVFKPFVYIIVAVALITYMLQTNSRCGVWNNTLTIWNDALEKYPQCIKGYNGRGDAYNELKEYELAVKDFDKALEMKVNYPDAYYNRGIAIYWLGKQALDRGEKQKAEEYFDKAIADNTMAIKYNPDLAMAYFNRSGNYYTKGQYELALTDALKAKQMGMEVDSLYIKALRSGIKR